MLQALWHCLRNPPDNVAHVAFRVLSKFGGSNRKMLKEAQKVCLIRVACFQIGSPADYSFAMTLATIPACLSLVVSCQYWNMLCFIIGTNDLRIKVRYKELSFTLVDIVLLLVFDWGFIFYTATLHTMILLVTNWQCQTNSAIRML